MAKKRTGKKRGETVKKARTARKPRRGRAVAPASSTFFEDTESAWRLRDEVLEGALLSGDYAGRIEAYLGEENYRELVDLAREAATRAVRGGPRVLILPGIMGSKLGEPGWLFDDLLWIDLVEIAAGKLERLALDGGPQPYKAVGVLLFAYLAFKLRLKLGGYDADFYPFDWRLSVDTLGDQLAQYILDKESGKVHLVAHSMGGLVARAAIGRHDEALKERIGRFIMLGTPNYGSFSPVLALRATHDTVRKVAAIDLTHTAEELVEHAFSTFPGLYQMLPAPEKFSGVDLYSLSTWPLDGPRPRPQLLSRVADVRKCFAAGRDGFYLIAGVNQQTITNLSIREGEFIYHKSVEGDGTVPLDFAELPDTRTYYVEEEHGSLPNNRQVAHAVKDILAEGQTARLWDRWSPARRGEVRLLRERELRVPAFEGRTGKDVLQREIRGIVAEFASSEAHDGAPAAAEAPVAAGAAGAGGAVPMEGVVVGRRRQHRIEIRLFRGSISDADARAYVLGVFRGVAPMGAARALDERLEGAITDFTRHRMFAGNVGEVFMMPTGRHVVRAENVVFVGLGPSDHFGHEAQELVSENAVRTLVRTKVEDFATVLVGAGTGLSTTKSLYHLLSGLFRGLRDVDDRNRFRSVTLCEIDKDRYVQIKEELYRLAGTSLFDDFEVTFDELEPLPPVAVAAPPRRPPPGPEPVYLTVRQESRNNVHESFRVSLLRAAKKATVLTDIKEFPSSELNAHLDKIELASFTVSRLSAYGDRLTELTLPEQIAGVLARDFERHLVVVHDSGAARVPWELIRIDGRFPASEGGLSRQYMAEDLSIAKWLEQRQYGPTLDILLVVNPTEDLDGAEEEGKRVQQLLADNPAIRVEVLRGPQATRSALRTRFQSGEYDVVHYAGHAFFDPIHRARSGILCHGRQVLSGADLASIGNLPALVFFNACEAGRIRRGAARRKKELAVEKRIERNIGLAEAFLRGGVANYVGTYWPVGDTPAKRFAETFYKKLLTGSTLGEALLAGRRVVKDIPSVDWADYIHYGCYDFRLKVMQ